MLREQKERGNTYKVDYGATGIQRLVGESNLVGTSGHSEEGYHVGEAYLRVIGQDERYGVSSQTTEDAAIGIRR